MMILQLNTFYWKISSFYFFQNSFKGYFLKAKQVLKYFVFGIIQINF